MPLPLPTLPPDNQTICLVIPNSPEWRQIYMGALQIMAQWWYWDVDNPTQSQDVIQRVMECAYLTSEDFYGCMDIDCQDIIDCINNTPELQQLISSMQTVSSIDDTTPEDASILATDILQGQGSVSCDNDSLYGASLQLTQLLNTVSENLLDIFVNGFNNASNLATVIEAIPVVGELPFDDILDFLEKVATQINTAYQSAYDTQLEEDISCLFFCESQLNCELTFEQARDVIKAELANPVSVQDFASVINDMIANNWFGQQSVYVFFYFILETIILGGEILGLDVNRFAKTVATYFNDPNPDWATLCTNCNSPVTETWDFTVSDHQPIWFPRPSQAGQMSWTNGVGWQGTNPGGSQLMTERYQRVTNVTVTYTSPTGECRVVDFGNIIMSGTCPFNGDHIMVNELLIECAISTGTGTATISEIEVTGFRA